MITNREYIINQLKYPDFLDDGGASYEAMLYYNIKCPYFTGDERCHCKSGKKEITRELCYYCKEEWLDMEVDEW